MLYGGEDEDEEGLASEITAIANDKVSIVTELVQCLLGIFSEMTSSRDRQQLLVKKNRLEAELFDLP